MLVLVRWMLLALAWVFGREDRGREDVDLDEDEDEDPDDEYAT